MSGNQLDPDDKSILIGCGMFLGASLLAGFGFLVYEILKLYLKAR